MAAQWFTSDADDVVRVFSRYKNIVGEVIEITTVGVITMAISVDNSKCGFRKFPAFPKSNSALTRHAIALHK